MDDLKQQNDDFKTRVAEMETTILNGKEKYGTLLKVRCFKPWINILITLNRSIKHLGKLRIFSIEILTNLRFYLNTH